MRLALAATPLGRVAGATLLADGEIQGRGILAATGSNRGNGFTGLDHVTGPLEQGQTMTGFIANAALGDSRVGSIEYDTLFAVGLLLFVITLLINFISIRLVRRIRQAY